MPDSTCLISLSPPPPPPAISGADDAHLVHGDLPNARYQKAHIAMGSDRRGHFLEVGGEYRHTVAFSKAWVARPAVRLYAGESTTPSPSPSRS